MTPLYGGHNFGDALNSWLWPRLIPDIYRPDNENLFIGIGSLMNQDWIPDTPPCKIVFGAGYAYGTPPSVEGWRIYCVRGPLTAETLRLPVSYAITDPALLVRLYERKLAHPLYTASFMPHEFSGRDNMWREVADWKAACESCGLHYIDARSPVDRVINEIAASKLLITEALHGAIVATALMIPWIPVRFYSHINCFKWRDWLATVGLEYQPVTIPLLDSSLGSKSFSFNRLLNANRRLRAHLSSHLAARAAKKNNPVLVPEDRVEALATRLLDKVAEFRREYF